MSTSTVSSKGRITIPKEIRERLRLAAGHRVEFRIDSTGRVTLIPRNNDIRSLKGVLRPRPRRPVTVEQMNQAILDRAKRI